MILVYYLAKRNTLTLVNVAKKKEFVIYALGGGGTMSG